MFIFLKVCFLYIFCFLTTDFVLTTAKSLQSCPTLCDPIDGSPTGSPVPGILQARTVEWVAISFSNASKWKVKSESEVAQSCPTLSDPMDCSLPGSSVHGTFLAGVLEWGAIAFSVYLLQKPIFSPYDFLRSSQFVAQSVDFAVGIFITYRERGTVSLFWNPSQRDFPRKCLSLYNS